MNKIWSREESKERFPLPISPLGWSLLEAPTQSTLDSLADHMHLKRLTPDEMIKNIDHYVYTRKGFFKVGAFKKIRLTYWFGFGFKLLWFFVKSFGNQFKFFNSIMRSFFQPRAVEVISQWDSLKTSLVDRLRQASAGDPRSEIELPEFLKIKDDMEKKSCDYFYHDFAVFFLKNIFFKWIQFLLKSSGKTPDETLHILTSISQGLTNNFSVNMALEKASLSHESWLSRYGHLTDNWDVFAPTLGEVSGHSVKILRTDLVDLHKSQEKNRIQTEIELSRVFDKHPNFMQSVSIFQKLLIIDEDMRAYSSLQYPQIRNLFRRVALTANWDFEDIFFLTLFEIQQGLKSKDFSSYAEIAKQRRSEYKTALKTNPPDEYSETNQQLKPLKNSKRPSYSGRSVSSGQVRGPALVVSSLEDLSRFSGQEILFLRSATPTYASFYSQCAGIVSETGGLLSHGALVAREFQIPMISDVSGALELVKTGDMIYLDATQGRFEVV